VTPLLDDEVPLPGGPRLAVRRAPGRERPFLLVHGLSSNARLWDGVAHRLVESGHEVVAVDQRGHGRSEQVADGYTTDRCAADLAELCEALGLHGDREPVAAGQSWGGNVVLTQAARHGGVAGLALVDGGWIALRERFPTFEECWAALAPPTFDGVTFDGLRERLRAWHPDWPDEGIEATLGNFAVRPDGTAVPRLAREHHQQIVRSLWEGDPRPLYARVRVPVLLAPAVPAGADDLRRAGPLAALELLPDATVSWYEGADHDLHAQQPDRLAADLLSLVDRVEDTGR
jgi:pimeloyl-ACP methyl ester carboxylesterase